MSFPWTQALRRLHPAKDRALMAAVKERQLALAEEWIEAGADLDATHLETRPVATTITTSPLVYAIEQQSAAMVRLLLSKGASVEQVAGRKTTNGPMTQWLVSLTRSTYMSTAQEDIGLALLEAGGDLKKGMVPDGSPILYDVLKQSGRLDQVDKLEMRFLAAEMARSLDQETPHSHPRASRPRI